jgi:hypothetical protein
MSLELYIQNTIANRAEDALVSNKELTLKSRGDAALGNVEILQGRTPWFGRLVSWVKQGTALFSSSIAKQNEAERADNRTLKEAVATAIEGILGNKAEAAEVVKTVIGPRYSGAKAITTRQLQQMIKKATDTNPQAIKNWQNARLYLVTQESLFGQISPSLKKHFFEAVRLSSDYEKRDLLDRDLKSLMEKTKESYNKEETAKLEETFPDLSSQLTVTGSPKSSLEALKKDLDKLEVTNPELKQAFNESIDHIKTAIALRAEIQFDPAKAIDLYYQLETNRAELQNCQTQLNELVVPEGKGLPEKVASLKKVLTSELSTQDARLTVKMESTAGYIESDPFSEKNMLRPRRIYAEATKEMAIKIIGSLDLRIEALATKMSEQYSPNAEDQEQLQSLTSAKRKLWDRTTEWHAQEVAIYETALNERSGPLPKPQKKSLGGEIYNKLFKTDATLKELKGFCKESGVPADITSSDLSKKAMKAATNKVMNEELDWNTTIRTMEASLGGITRSYQQTSTPLSEGNTAVAAKMKEAGVKGIVPASRNEANQGFAINARMTKLEKMDDQGKVTLVHERQQHGIVDHFQIKDAKKRAAANKKSAQQLILHGIETDPNFIEKALENGKDPKSTSATNKVFYINTNLTTPTYTHREMPGKAESHNEYRYSINQGIAFDSAIINQNNEYTVHDANGEEQTISAEVTFIDFRFPVNYALDDSIDPGLIQAWKDLKIHNRGEFTKLFGSLEVSDKGPTEGVMKDVYDKLKEKNGDIKAQAIVAEMEEQCFYLRSMFNDEDYKSANGDRFKMPRHIDLLNNTFRQGAELLRDKGVNIRVVNAGGCMSGKDREGVANASGQAAAMIKDMGGVVAPGHLNTSEERTILNTAIVGVVDNTLQVTGFGGSKNAKEIGNEMNDPDAVIYAAGTSKNAKT